MLLKIAKDINYKKYFWAVGAAFLFNNIHGYFFRDYFIMNKIIESHSVIFQSKGEIFFSWFWLILGHLFQTSFTAFLVIAGADQKSLTEVIKLGLIMGLLFASELFILNAFVDFPPLLLWSAVANYFFIAVCDSVIVAKVYKEIKN
jgi:hypothetical protein